MRIKNLFSYNLDIKNIFNKNKRLIQSIFIFLLVFCTLGLPYNEWRFVSDDVGNIFYSSKIDNLGNFFIKGGLIKMFYPCNYIDIKADFFIGFYRPLTLFFYFLQAIFFKFNSYYYFLFTIFLHALCAVFLFNLLLGFVELKAAFLASLFFSYHSSLASWLGWISAQQQQFTLIFLFLILFFYKKYLKTNILIYYFVSLYIFLMAIFTRENIIILPLILFLYLILIYKKNVFKNLILLLGFIIPVLIYFLFRVIALDFCISVQNNNLIIIFNKITGFLRYFVGDIFSFTWLPWGYIYIKIIFILPILFLLFFLFLFNKQKILIIFFILSGLILSWPAIYSVYDARYLYEGLPFFIVGFALCFNFEYKKYFFIKKLLNIILILLIIINFIYLSYNLYDRENQSIIIDEAFNELSKNNLIKKQPIVFIFLHRSFMSSNAQTFWLKTNRNNVIYQDFNFASVGIDQNKSFFKKILRNQHNWFCDLDVNFDKDYLDISFIKDGFRFKTLDKEKIFFVKVGTQLGGIEISKNLVNKFANDGIYEDINIIFNKEILEKKPIFITWDYYHKNFKVLND